MTAHFDPSVYGQLSPEARLYALGLFPFFQTPRSFEDFGRALGRLSHEMDTYRGAADILDTQARTREKFGKGPFSAQVIGREVLKRWVTPLALHLARKRRPKGLESVLRGLSSRQLAFLALRAVLDRIHAGWDQRKRGQKRIKIKNPDRHFRQELGCAVRDELEYMGLLASKKWVDATEKNIDRRARLGKLHKLDWSNRERARVGDWLWDALAALSCFDEDDRGYPKIADDHKAALDEFAEELVFKHPLYMPSQSEPPPWTSFRAEYDDRIRANFVKANHPDTIAEPPLRTARLSPMRWASARSSECRSRSIPLRCPC
jgi:hypothetical protein